MIRWSAVFHAAHLVAAWAGRRISGVNARYPESRVKPPIEAAIDALIGQAPKKREVWIAGSQDRNAYNTGVGDITRFEHSLARGKDYAAAGGSVLDAIRAAATAEDAETIWRRAVAETRPSRGTLRKWRRALKGKS